MTFFLPQNPLQSASNVYDLYNLSIVSNLHFYLPLRESTQKPNLKLTWEVNAQAVEMELNDENRVYSSPYKINDQSIIQLYQYENYYIMRFTNTADFYVTSESIACYLADDNVFSLAESLFTGAVISFLLEMRNTPVLHASCVAEDQFSAVFLSNSGSGKSTLAAYLIQQGWSLLTDDILPIDIKQGTVYGRSGFPGMKLFPEQAKFLCDDINQLNKVSNGSSKRWVWLGKNSKGSFCSQDRPLSCIYVPSRQSPTAWGTGVEITPIKPRDGVIELLRYSFSARVVDALKMRKHRLDFFSEVVSIVPLRRITYPSGMEFLPAVQDAILRDLAANGLA